ncbi:MAG: ubiquitin-like protein Pup [Acidimicrobiia bacterium]
MAEQEKSKPRSRDQKTDEVEEIEVVESESDLDELDDLLDEIDSVLEENAEEFVKNYVQKGGQ